MLNSFCKYFCCEFYILIFLAEDLLIIYILIFFEVSVIFFLRGSGNGRYVEAQIESAHRGEKNAGAPHVWLCATRPCMRV